MKIAHVLVWLGHPRSKNWEHRIGDYLKKMGHEVIRIPYPTWPKPWFECDVVFSSHHMATPLAMHIAEREKVPLVAQVLDVPRFRLEGREPWSSNLERYVGVPLWKYRREWEEMAEALRKASLVVSISERTRRDVEEVFGVASVVNHLGVDVEAADSCLANPAEPVQRRPQCCAIGNLYDHKRFDLLVRTFNRLNRRLVIMGEGYMRPQLEDLAGFNVVLAGAVTEEQKYRILQRSKALVHASVCEGFWIPGCEALYSCTPAIAYELESLREVYGESIYYWREERELEELVEKAMGGELKADRNYVLSRGLTLKACAERLSRLLENV